MPTPMSTPAKVFELTPEIMTDIKAWLRKWQVILSDALMIPMNLMDFAHTVLPQPKHLLQMGSLTVSKLCNDGDWKYLFEELNHMVNLATRVCSIQTLTDVFHQFTNCSVTNIGDRNPSEQPKPDGEIHDWNRAIGFIFALDAALSPESPLWKNKVFLGTNFGSPHWAVQAEINTGIRDLLFPILGQVDKRMWSSYKVAVRQTEATMRVDFREVGDRSEASLKQFQANLQAVFTKEMGIWGGVSHLAKSINKKNMDLLLKEVLSFFDSFNSDQWISLHRSLVTLGQLELTIRAMAEIVSCAQTGNRGVHNFLLPELSTTPQKKGHLRTNSAAITIAHRRQSSASSLDQYQGHSSIRDQPNSFDFPRYLDFDIDDLPAQSFRLTAILPTLPMIRNQPFPRTSARLVHEVLAGVFMIDGSLKDL